MSQIAACPFPSSSFPLGAAFRPSGNGTSRYSSLTSSLPQLHASGLFIIVAAPTVSPQSVISSSWHIPSNCTNRSYSWTRAAPWQERRRVRHPPRRKPRADPLRERRPRHEPQHVAHVPKVAVVRDAPQATSVRLLVLRLAVRACRRRRGRFWQCPCYIWRAGMRALARPRARPLPSRLLRAWPALQRTLGVSRALCTAIAT